MTFPLSGTIQLSEFRTELYGDSATPAGLTSFYRVTGLGDFGAMTSNAYNAAIPTSGTIGMTDFYGASGARFWTARVTSGAGSFSAISGSTVPFTGTDVATILEIDLKVPAARSVLGASFTSLTKNSGAGDLAHTGGIFFPGLNVVTFEFDRTTGGACNYTLVCTIGRSVPRAPLLVHDYVALMTLDALMAALVPILDRLPNLFLCLRELRWRLAVQKSAH